MLVCSLYRNNLYCSNELRI